MADSFLIKKPWVTEKAGSLSPIGQYIFMVKPGATKPEVKKAVKEIYKVDVVSVSMVNRPAKKKRSGRGLKRTQEAYRKAIVTLKTGQKIDIQ
jgi:large subunit ribosomal protein L23